MGRKAESCYSITITYNDKLNTHAITYVETKLKNCERRIYDFKLSCIKNDYMPIQVSYKIIDLKTGVIVRETLLEHKAIRKGIRQIITRRNEK